MSEQLEAQKNQRFTFTIDVEKGTSFMHIMMWMW